MNSYGYRSLLSLFFCICFAQPFHAQKLSMYVDGQKHYVENLLEFNSDYHDIIFFFENQRNYGCQYLFRLEGLEQTDMSSAYPIIRYTNLSGGRYRFYGKIVRNGQVLKRFLVPFEIKENFWEKWWFWLFVAIVISSLISIVVYFWFLYDFRQRMKVQEIRQRIAADLHDEVGANLSSITFFVELLRKKLHKSDSELSPLLEKISRNSQESATLINDTIWALNPDYDSFEKMAGKMKSFAAEILSARDIALNFQPVPEMKFDLSIDQRRDIYLIFKEAVNNAAKHSGASQVIIGMSNVDGTLQISVKDDGIGFDCQNTYEGNGLKNYNHRSRSGEAKVKIQSTPGAGTEITILTNIQNHQN